jgi:hypothetical protein
VHGVLIIGGSTFCVVVGGGSTVHVVIIGPTLTQLHTRGPLVPSKVCYVCPINVHAEDPHNVLLILVPLVNVFLMVDVEFLHTSLTNTMKPAKLQFTY